MNASAFRGLHPNVKRPPPHMKSPAWFFFQIFSRFGPEPPPMEGKTSFFGFPFFLHLDQATEEVAPQRRLKLSLFLVGFAGLASPPILARIFFPPTKGYKSFSFRAFPKSTSARAPPNEDGPSAINPFPSALGSQNGAASPRVVQILSPNKVPHFRAPSGSIPSFRYSDSL